MKKILILLILLFALFFISCDNKNEKTPNADPNVSGEGQPGDKEPDPNGGEKDPDPDGEGEKDPDPNSEGEKDPDPLEEDPALTFNEDDFKYEIIITKCDNNYKKKITSDNYEELFDKIKDFTYQKYEQCTSCDTPLYKIAYNNIVISIYEYNFFKINDELFELISGSFDFLSQFEYVDSNSSGWLPWI